jgi:hypothetical protein
LAAAIAALLVVPALALADNLLDLLQGPPAPSEVKTFFAADNEMREQLFAYADQAGQTLHDRYSPVVADEARGVAAIESPDGPIYLWAAPTEDGRQCWLIQAGAEEATGRPYGMGTCDGEDTSKAMLPSLYGTIERPSVRIVHVRVYDEAITRVDVQVDGAADLSLPVVAGHALGTVPKDATVTRYVGRDADGDVVARVEQQSD